MAKTDKNNPIKKRGKRLQIFEYLINLDVKNITVPVIAKEVGLKERQTYRYLTSEFWQEVLDARRKQYPKLSVTVDMGLAKKAAKGGAAEVKLFYQRFEGWKEPKAPMELTGEIKTGTSFADGLKQVRDQMKSNPEEEERLLGEVIDE